MKVFCRFACLVIFLHFSKKGIGQCFIPSDNGDTLFPVINRMISPNPFGGTSNPDRRKTIYESVNIGNTLYIGGDFQYIGPNTGTGVIMSETGTQVLTYKKWRINGPVFASVPDGTGGYYIGGIFTKIGDSIRYNIAHIDQDGIPTNWKPVVNDLVKAIALLNDTLFIGGQFTSINGATRNAFAMLNKNVDTLLPLIAANNTLQPGAIINTFKLVDNILYVGGKHNIFTTVGSAFKIFTNTGGVSSLPTAFQMEDVYSIDISEGKSRVYIGGHAGSGTAISNGLCMNANTGALLYRMDVGVQSHPDLGGIYQIKAIGRNVYAGGLFNYGTINNNGFTQKGLIVFDTATGQLRTYLNNCNGFIKSVHSKGDKVYLGGEFTSIGGTSVINFAVFDTTLLTVSNNALPFSDQIQTIAFTGNQMFVGGSFQSIGCSTRNGFAAFDINTGVINSWQPNFSAIELNDMKAKGDTIFMAGYFSQTAVPPILGSFVAVNATTGNYYATGPNLAGYGYDILIDNDSLYVGGPLGHFGNNNIVKIIISTLTEVAAWKPNVGYDVKSLQKRNGKIYGVGDTHRINIDNGYISEINAASGLLLRTTTLGPNGGFSWVSSGTLIGNKLFFSGTFNSVTNIPRKNFAVFDIDEWQLSPINVKVLGSNSFSKLINQSGNVYFASSYVSINDKTHRYFSVIDTTVGAVFPDRLKLNNDDPFGYPLDDYENYERLNTIQIINDQLVLGGNFRNVNKNMYPSLAKLQMVPGGSIPIPPQGINGSGTLQCPSLNNLYTIINPDPDLRYAWFYSGTDVVIRNNGIDSVFLDVGSLATPGQLKVVALNECGKSDTAFLNIVINTLEPTINASNLLLVRKTDTTATIRFTPGNGARRIVVAKALTAITNLPQDSQEYIADSSFGIGSNLGNNTFVIYKGTGDSANLKGLTPETIYYVTVFEFNGINANTNYLTTGNPSINFTTLAIRPTIQPGNLIINNVTETSITISCTPGNGIGRLIVVRLSSSGVVTPINGIGYSASPIFGNGSDIGNSNFVVSLGTVPVTVTNLLPNTQYGITLFEYNGTGDASNYLLTNFPSTILRTMAIEPTIQASNILVSAITNNSCTINCTPGNGQWRLVVMRKDNPVTFIPQDSIFYQWGSSNAIFGTGADLGGNTYVLNSATPIFVTNLTPNTVYHIAAFEFNGYGMNNNYLTTPVPTALFSTSPTTPTVQANSLSISNITTTTATSTCNSGNGTNRLFVIRAGSPVINNPVDGMDYSANSAFGLGSNIGNNTFVLSKLQPVNITALTPGTTYYLKVFEYNGIGQSTRYLIPGAPSLNFTTQVQLAPEPTVPASGIIISNISSINATINCTSGNGANRLVVIRAGTTLSSMPADGIGYNANTIFSSGSDIGNQTYVISNTTTPVTVTGLTANTDYTISIFEFNGSGATSNYLTINNPIYTFHTFAAEPNIQASNIVISNTSVNSATINCTIGNGANRLVVIRTGTILSSLPADGIGYNANTIFGGGSDIGSQTYVISNTNTPVTVTGLTANTDYTVTIFEFNGSGNSSNYLTINNPIITFQTNSEEPIIQATNIVVTNISDISATINCTNGSGANRLVVIRAGTSLTSLPVDGTSYNASTIFGVGSDIGSQTYVISNTNTPVTVTGLIANTDYTISIFEFNGNGTNTNYLTSNNPLSVFHTIAAEPTNQASNIVINNVSQNNATINCTNGNGSNRLVVIREGTSLTAQPIDGTAYNANPIFGSGSDIGNQTYVLSNTNTPVTVTGLTANSDYIIRVFEFNGNGNSTNYLIQNSPALGFRTNFITGIIDLNLPGTTINVFPNPVYNNQIQVTINTNKRGKFITEIFSVSGVRQILKESQISNNFTTYTFDLSKLVGNNILFIRCSFQMKNGVTKIIKF